VLTSSLTFLHQARLQTWNIIKQPMRIYSRKNRHSIYRDHGTKNKKLAWLPVSIELRAFPLAVFQKRIHLSAVPPPDARRPCWCGDHAIALTAAVCCVSRNTGCCDRWFHTNSWLSFPPEASSRSSCDHLRPQT
jgi:hypothetical protein